MNEIIRIHIGRNTDRIYTLDFDCAEAFQNSSRIKFRHNVAWYGTYTVSRGHVKLLLGIGSSNVLAKLGVGEAQFDKWGFYFVKMYSASIAIDPNMFTKKANMWNNTKVECFS